VCTKDELNGFHRLPSLEDLRRLGRLRLRAREIDELLESEESESDELASEESEELDESESVPEESEPEDGGERRDLFLSLFPPFPFPSFCSLACSRSFSLASSIWFAVPVVFLNSCGTSTEGFPASLSFASTLGFSSCCVREGRETYGRVDLHS